MILEKNVLNMLKTQDRPVDNSILPGQKKQIRKPTKKQSSSKNERQQNSEFDFTGRAFQAWLIRSGISPASSLPAHRIGLYTDFV
ncbi:MAG: hypothetical protein A3C35_04745 [Omnitrophica bacterium RIFCSPHIGHO2_02_FULL_46_11]|nr:MAG: hypothetical protein A3C35_04745 [Omnitrophica bacterium RIFCSPHIGHO2_02_FULL_46_11]OGW87749.1 MAG: hypothetical protein A3A81_01440 [Omnitrophica bacterium RIFCSPLOWO2_01_FULL_45_10b]